jgi:hypothetical protein
MNLTKDINDLCKENYKPSKKEIKDYRRWKYFPCSWIGRISIVNIALVPKEIYIFSTVPMEIPITYITKIDKSTLKFIWKPILSKKGNAGCNTIADFKLHYRALVIKTTG